MRQHPRTSASTWWPAILAVALVLAPAAADAQTDKSARRPAAKSPAEAPDPIASLDATIKAAERALQEGERQQAESLYRDSLFDGWMLLGSLRVASASLAEARLAFERASRAAVSADAALQALAIVHLQTGRAAEAAGILTPLAGRRPGDIPLQRLLAQALMAAGAAGESVQVLEAARVNAADDPELAFLLGSAYLRSKKLEAAEKLFAEVSAAQPGAETDVLLGRTYRDAGEHDRARAALRRALKKNATARRAHYYLGTVAILRDGVLGLDEAIGEFQAELRLTPGDVVTSLRLGMALVEAQRPREALPYLESARHAQPPAAEAFYYLGRCYLALDRAADAVSAFERALSIAGTLALDPARVGGIHYQMALALRQAGQAEAAARHFEEAKTASQRRADRDRDHLTQYLAESATGDGALGILPLESPLAGVPAEHRGELQRLIGATLARAYLNLGVLQAQSQQFRRAAELLAEAAALAPDFPRVQYSLGVALFNSQQYDEAIEPLTRAFAQEPENAVLRRMLGLSHFQAEHYDRAADLLGSDADREADPQLQYAYALALVRSGRTGTAEPIFARLIEQHGHRADLHVVLGQAHAHQGDYESAVAALTRALELDPKVAEANTALGIIYLRQGRLPEAAAALRAELAAHPGDLRAQHTLATVLELEGKPDEAMSILRSVLRSRPAHASARYLLGKILLARGAAEEAVEQLEAAVRLSPTDANAHYQLGQAFQKLGQTARADEQFALFRKLKDQRREPRP